MSMDVATFRGDVIMQCLIHYANANRSAELTALATPLNTDTRKHDKTIEAAPTSALQAGHPANSRFTNDVLLNVNTALAGNLTGAQISAVLSSIAAAVPNPPH